MPFFLCCAYKYIWKTGKSPGSLEICAALSAFSSPFCSAYSTVGSWTRPRLHNLLSGISNIYTSQNDLKTHLKSQMAQKKQTEWKRLIFICSYYSSMMAKLWDERIRVKAGRSPQTRKRGNHRKWQREKNHKFPRLPSLSCKATAKKMANM